MLNQDFKAFIQSLYDNGIRFLVIDEYAVALHGYPHYTKDIDIWIEMTPDNAAKMVRAIDRFGSGSLGLREADFLAPDQIIQLGHPPSRIDLVTTPPGVDFAECYAARVDVEVDGVLVSFIDLENLKKNKQASGRLLGLADLEHLQ